MLSQADALARVQSEIEAPETYYFEKVALEQYQRRQASLCVPWPREPDPEETQKVVCMTRIQDVAIEPGKVVTFHFGVLPDELVVLWSYFQG